MVAVIFLSLTFINVLASAIPHLVASVTDTRMTVRCAFEFAPRMITTNSRVLFTRVDCFAFAATVTKVTGHTLAAVRPRRIDANCVVRTQLSSRQTLIDISAQKSRWVLFTAIDTRKTATTFT